MADGYLSFEQYEQLKKPINPSRVSKDGKGFSHLEAHDVRAHLNRLFGFLRWSAETKSCDLIFETEIPPGEHKYKDGKTNPKTIWTVCYKALVRLEVSSPRGRQLAAYSEFAAGDAVNYPFRQEAHDMAIKTAESQALKRCAVNLGDQFGLSLYNSGSLKAVVGHSLVVPEKEEPEVSEQETPEVGAIQVTKKLEADLLDMVAINNR